MSLEAAEREMHEKVERDDRWILDRTDRFTAHINGRPKKMTRVVIGGVSFGDPDSIAAQRELGLFAADYDVGCFKCGRLGDVLWHKSGEYDRGPWIVCADCAREYRASKRRSKKAR